MGVYRVYSTYDKGNHPWVHRIYKGIQYDKSKHGYTGLGQKGHTGYTELLG